MLSNRYFYHQLTRKYVILMGNMFNNMMIMRKDKTTGEEIERIRIPIIYAPKEKFITHLESDPDLQREQQVTLPRMSFQITGITYDASRKQNSLLKNPQPSTATTSKSQYVGVPYDIEFELNIYTRNIDDGTHIVEQIMPYFNPDYTVTINPVSGMGFLKDVPIILNSITNNIEHEGNFDSVRFVTWRLTFTMKAHFYGPVTESKIIRKIDVNFFNDPSIKAGYITRAYVTGNGSFKLDDTVFQGPDFKTAQAYGTVVAWNENLNLLTLGGVQGQFKVNNTIHAVSSNAAYTLDSFYETPIKLVNIHIDPDPVDAEPDDDYGFTTTISEWPDTA